MFQNLRHSDTCDQVKSCTKRGRSGQSQRELTVALTYQKGLLEYQSCQEFGMVMESKRRKFSTPHTATHTCNVQKVKIHD